jgi:RimJ/RimL family protein N-acetyltransferase
MIEARQGIFKAVPLDLSDPSKLTYILDRLVEHESEWSDFHSDPETRRVLASQMLSECYAPQPRVAILEVWFLCDGEPHLVGLAGFTAINPKVNADFHPVFFDGKLRNAFGKREILLRVMDWAFHAYGLHRLSIALPETSFALVDFTRKKLGFRFEGESRIVKQRRVVTHGHLKSHRWLPVTPTAREAELGSRRHQAILKNGQWHDELLLSVTRDEFAAFVREELCRTSSTAQPHSKPSPAT